MWCRKLQTFFICDFSYAGPAMCLWFPIIAKISWISHPPALLLSSLRLTLAYTLITFHSPPCVFLSSNFNLYLLSSPFVSSKPSHNLPGLCSSLSSFLFLYFKPAVKSFGKARFSSLLFFIFYFFLGPSFPHFLFQLCCAFSTPHLLPPTLQTLLMDPVSAEYQSKPHNCTVASCLSLLHCLSTPSIKKRGTKKWIENCWTRKQKECFTGQIKTLKLIF